MTSLLPSTASAGRATPDEPTAGPRRRPVLLLASSAGVLAAGLSLLVCVLLALLGWFLSDLGVHGEPRSALAAGAGGWLVGHGSGIVVRGAPVTLVPLGLTLLAAWCTWRVARGLGERLWAHGPDAHDLADGARDWTVPVGVAGFGAGYAAVALALGSALGETFPSAGGSVLLRVLALTLLVAGPAVATGSGRASVWATGLPPWARHAASTARHAVLLHLLLATVLLLGALLLDLDEAANLVERLHTSPGETVLLVLVSLALLPNAVLCAGAFLAGPGFAVGGATLVSPGSVVLGPLPVLPLLAALPDEGAPLAWPWLVMLVPGTVAAVAAVRTQRRRPTLRWDHGALRGCVGGVGAGLVLTALTALAGGAAGPGRMRFVGPLTGDVLVHLVTAMGIGGLLGGLAVTWWQRHTSEPADEPVDEPAEPAAPVDGDGPTPDGH
ncbi:DUF6350 family protein [Nocardioides solisilvae]|uniref:cell division protein PerM n=1 Tax=Nocardioides solisilvae TaxID=1542435 RepID=UPI00194DB863|nr:DUF6350 family protein [Nocardioides solisilvae]